MSGFISLHVHTKHASAWEAAKEPIWLAHLLPFPAGKEESMPCQSFACQVMKLQHFIMKRGYLEYINLEPDHEAGQNSDTVVLFKMSLGLSFQLEALNQSINIEQSQSDRSKRPFNPVMWVLAYHLDEGRECQIRPGAGDRRVTCNLQYFSICSLSPYSDLCAGQRRLGRTWWIEVFGLLMSPDP